MFAILSLYFRRIIPAGIWCKNDVVSTSMRRDYVASTLIRRHFGTKCLLGLHHMHCKTKIGRFHFSTVTVFSEVVQFFLLNFSANGIQYKPEIKVILQLLIHHMKNNSI